MTISGTIYGVILNDADERTALAASFGAAPYGKMPVAPVVYIKPGQCVSQGVVRVPADVDAVEAAPTLALLFGRDATDVAADEAMAFVGATCLALDVCVPHASHYRPAVAQRCRDGFLPLGRFVSTGLPAAIATWIDGTPAHRWSLDRLVRPVPSLVADLSRFMTLRAGDMLLIGLPGDAPRVGPGRTVRVEADGLPPLEASFAGAIP